MRSLKCTSDQQGSAGSVEPEKSTEVAAQLGLRTHQQVLAAAQHGGRGVGTRGRARRLRSLWHQTGRIWLRLRNWSARFGLFLRGQRRDMGSPRHQAVGLGGCGHWASRAAGPRLRRSGHPERFLLQLKPARSARDRGVTAAPFLGSGGKAGPAPARVSAWPSRSGAQAPSAGERAGSWGRPRGWGGRAVSARGRDGFLFPRAEAWGLTGVGPGATARFDTDLCYRTQRPSALGLWRATFREAGGVAGVGRRGGGWAPLCALVALTPITCAAAAEADPQVPPCAYGTETPGHRPRFTLQHCICNSDAY